MATRQILISLHLASMITMIMASLCPDNPSAIVTHSNNNGKSQQLPKDLCHKLKCDMKKRKCCCCENNQIVCNSLDMALDSVSKMGRPDSVKIVLYSAPTNLTSQCPSDSHVITGMHDFSDVHLLEFVGGYKYNNSLLCCNARSSITVPGSCEVYLKNVTIINCLINRKVINTVTISSSGASIRSNVRVQSQHNKHLEQLFTTRKIKSTQISKCQSSLSRNIHNLCERGHVLCACNYETDEDVTVCIQERYWCGVVDNTIVTAPCKYKKCKVSIAQGTECPLTRSSGMQFYEMFSEMIINGSNCTNNRKGTLCSECDENHAFTFGAYSCVKFTNNKYAGAIIISIIFALLIITGLLFCFRFRDVNLASINGFVLFFSIVHHLIPEVPNGGGFEADYAIDVFISIFESFSQLQPEFLSFVPFPFVLESCKGLCTVGLQYIFPLSILIFLLSLVPILSNCSPEKCQKFAFGSNTWVKSICLMFLLTFTSLTETSIRILHPRRFDGIEGNYISLQPQTRYLEDQWRHKLLFSLALIIEILLQLIVAIILLSPCLIRICNPLKLKPFLDEFHGGYKEKYHFMATSYFIYRQIILLITLSPNYTDAIVAMHLVTMVMLILHLAIRPYRSRLLNIIDGVFLTTLVLISYIYAIPYFQNEDRRTFRIVIISTLLIFPASYPFLLLILPWRGKAEQWNKYDKLRCKYFPYIKNYRAEANSRVPPLIIHEENEPDGLRTRIASFFSFSIRSSYHSSNRDLSRSTNRVPSIDNEIIGTPLVPTMTVIDGFDMQGEQQTEFTANVSQKPGNDKDSVISSARHWSESEFSNENKKKKKIRPYHTAHALTKPLLQAMPEKNQSLETSDEL